MSFNKSKINFWVNLGLWVNFIMLLGVGFILKWGLPRQGRFRIGPKFSSSFLGLSKHDWGEVHFVFGLIFFILLGIHLFLHWKCIREAFSHCLPNRWVRWGMIGILVLGTLFSLFVWVLGRSQNNFPNRMNFETSVEGPIFSGERGKESPGFGNQRRRGMNRRSGEVQGEF